ncbi:MAG: hypothetical protein ACRCUY_13010 [Thermoguttaceae bacterium]
MIIELYRRYFGINAPIELRVDGMICNIFFPPGVDVILLQWGKRVYKVSGNNNRYIHEFADELCEHNVNLVLFADIHLESQTTSSKWRLIAERKFPYGLSASGWSLVSDNRALTEKGLCIHCWNLSARCIVMYSKINLYGLIATGHPYMRCKARRSIVNNFPLMIPIILATYYELN